MRINDKDVYFVGCVKPDRDTISWYPIGTDDTVFTGATCDSLEELEKIAPCFSLGMSLSTMRANINCVIKQRRAAGVTDDYALKRNNIYREVVTEHLVFIESPPTVYLNCDSMKPCVKVGIDPLTDQVVLNKYEDIIIKYDPTVIREDPIIRDFYAQLENGDCLLHYLNEFRHNRPLPAILTAGYGGSGKSTVLKHYTTYKQPCKTYFSGDLSVGNFGKTSLILCEEAEKDSCKTLSLNKVKDMVTTEWHNVRTLYKDGFTAHGSVTLLFSANDRGESLVLRLYNHKGDDAKSIRRRTSTFHFNEANTEYLNKTQHGKYLNTTAIERPLSGKRSTPIDAHLNYLESIGFFNNPRFEKTGDNKFLLIYSPHVSLGGKLYARSAKILEHLYEAFSGTDSYKMLRSSDLMDAFKSERRGAIGLVTMGEDLEYVCPSTFEIDRVNGDYLIHLKNRGLLTDTYMAHIEGTNVVPPASVTKLMGVPKHNVRFDIPLTKEDV
jgi:hypothetical protein